MKLLQIVFLLITSVNIGIAQQKFTDITIANDYSKSYDSPIFVPYGTRIWVELDSGMYVVNSMRMNFYKELHRMAKDTSQFSLVTGVLRNYDELITQEIEVTAKMNQQYLKTTDFVRNEINEITQTSLLRITENLEEQKELIVTMQKQNEDLKKALDKADKDAGIRGFGKSVMWATIGTAIGYLIVKL